MRTGCRVGTKQTVAGLMCVITMMILAVPVSTDAGSARKGQAGRATTTKKTDPRARQEPRAMQSAQRCPCQTLPAGGGTLPSSVRLPSPAHIRALLGAGQGSGLRGQASWRRAARQALYARRLMLLGLPSLIHNQQPQSLDSWKIRLIDGDTFAYGAQRIRIKGIDTPEKSESGGFEATQRLDLLLHEGPVTIVPEALDKYGRTLADVYVNDRNVADVLKDEGYAKTRSR